MSSKQPRLCRASREESEKRGMSDERLVLAYEGDLTAVLDEEVCLAHPAQLARRPFINGGGRLCGRGGPDPTVGL